MKKTDFILILMSLALAFFLMLTANRAPGDTVKITKNGRFFAEKSLYTHCEINIDGKNTAVIENGCIYMKYADCPDKLCIKQGRISDSSEKIVCLPNRVIIEVTKKSDTDTVVK